MKNETLISFRGVCKTYKGDFLGKAHPALHDLSLEIKAGEILGIIGRNGAGKSTTLKILLGFIKHDSGEVRLKNLPPDNPEAHERLGYLPENPCLYENLTITEQLEFAARVAGLSAQAATERIKQVLDRMDLVQVAKTPLRKFSKGMTQRAALAYALMHEPDILILDEPMSGLDPLGRQLVVDIIREYHGQGKTVLFCSHILSDVERICTRIGIMNQGRLVADLRPAELPDVSDSFPDKTPLEAFFLHTIANDREENG